MAPGEKREMAVVFYVDPAFADDSENDGVNTITLSYTFYPGEGSRAEAGGGERTGQAQGQHRLDGLKLEIDF